MVQEATKRAVMAVLEIDSGADATLKASVASLLDNRKVRVSTPKAAEMLGVSKRTLLRKVESGEWPLEIDYESRSCSFCYLAQIEALISHNDDVPTAAELGVSPRPWMFGNVGECVGV